MWVETMSSRVCGDGLISAADGDDAFAGVYVVDCTFSFRSCEMCCPDRIMGSGTLPVSSVCDTVVMWARRGRRNVGGNADRDSRMHCRAERANSAIVMFAMLDWLLRHFFAAELRSKSGMHAKAALRWNFRNAKSSPQHQPPLRSEDIQKSPCLRTSISSAGRSSMSFHAPHPLFRPIYDIPFVLRRH